MIYKPRKFARNILMLSALCVCSAAAMAQGSGEKSREIILAPYLWGAAIDGTGTVGNLPPLAIDASFSDILSNLNFAMSLHTEFRFNDWVFVVDPTYISLEMEAVLPPPIPAGTVLPIEVDIWLVELWTGYRVHENWEVFGGLRYNDQDISMSGLPSPPLPVTSAGVSVSWTDGFIGARFNTDLGEKWYLTGRADVVVAGDSESGWNASIMCNRRYENRKSLNIGYRYMDIDFDDSGVYGWDVVQSGPVIGYTWTF